MLIALESKAEKERLVGLINKLNAANPGANYTLQSFCVAAIWAAVEKYEKKFQDEWKLAQNEGGDY